MGIFVMEGGTFIGEGGTIFDIFWFCAGGTFIRNRYADFFTKSCWGYVY